MSSSLISMYMCDHPGCGRSSPGNGLYDPPDGWVVDDPDVDHSTCWCPTHASDEDDVDASIDGRPIR